MLACSVRPGPYPMYIARFLRMTPPLGCFSAFKSAHRLVKYKLECNLKLSLDNFSPYNICRLVYAIQI